MRILGTSLGLLLIGAALTPAQAQQVSPDGRAYREYTVFGNDACPPSQDNEIVVCNRRPENERYRLPPNTRQPAGTAGESEGWGARAMAIDSLGKSTPSSCSNVGAANSAGCARKQLKDIVAADKAGNEGATTLP